MYKGFEYKTFSEAPKTHRAVVAHACVDGMTSEMVAKRLGMEEAYVDRILNHLPVKEYVEALREGVVLTRLNQYRGFQELLEDAITKTREAIKLPMSPKELTSLLATLLKHHPEGMFTAKKGAVPQASDSPYRREMLERAKALGVESAGTVLEGEFQMVDERSSESVSVHEPELSVVGGDW